MRKTVKIILIALGALLGAIAVVVTGYIYNNLNYYKAPLQATTRAGFKEKQVTLKDGTVLNYAEGPASGPALLLIHGQMVSWEDFGTVLPELSKHYHIFAVDCHGHGKSSKNPKKYRAEAMGEDFVWFIENVIREPAVVSGHSSGGLLTAWMAAKSPRNVRGIVLEDPPFFSTEASRIRKTFAWIDTFEPAHRFLEQRGKGDYVLYYLKNCYWLKYFGNGQAGLLTYATSYREKHPHTHMEIFFLPPSINHSFLFMNSYDPRFADTFYDCSWMENFNHAETLSRIDCPSVLIHTSWSYDPNGMLLAAMSGEDAARAHSLIKGNALINVVSGHDFHFEKPKEFIHIIVDFLNRIR
jgi:pimeloyl-ACP methyl ester carboxylesterase